MQLVRGRGIEAGVIAVALGLAACAPHFEHLAPTSPAVSGLELDRIELRWSNVYLIRKAGAAVLVDAGSPSDREALVAALAARGVTPAQIKAIVVTHAHADHAGCARWLQQQGAAIVLGAGDAAVAARGDNDPLQATNLLGALLAPVFMFPFEPFTPDVAVDHDVDLADRGFAEVQVVPLPGHTPGSIGAIVGGDALAGDVVKGGLVGGEHTPSEHLYQTDRLADHAALAALLARGVARIDPGHKGPLDARDVRAWLDGAAPESGDRAVSIGLDVRGELPRHGDAGATAGARVRAWFGRGALGASYVLGADVRGGYLGGGVYELDGHPIGVALRSAHGAFAAVTGGAGLGGVRGAGASHAVVELSAEAPAGPVRLIARAGLGWALGGPAYAGDVRGVADELTALAGVRLGGDRGWGAYTGGHGPYLAVSYRDLGGAELLGLVLGFDTFAGK
ncbi:MAG TPA: MBL fold metallo-hydrolase [Kofleriaceae bacterium]